MSTAVINNAMREAFIRLPGSVASTKVGRAIVKSILNGSGVKKDPKGWSTNLSFRTYTKLKADGIVQ